jgi:hypothetical protein
MAKKNAQDPGPDPLRHALLAELTEAEQQLSELRSLVGQPADVAVRTQAKVLLALESLGGRLSRLVVEWGEGKTLFPEEGAG